MGGVPQEPGVYTGLKFDQYALIPAVNFTKLNKFRDTPAHAHHFILHEADSTPTQRLGQLIHLAVLEPARFQESVVVRPKLDRRTKEGKAAWARFETLHSSKEIASEEEMETCRGILHSVSQHATAREILHGRGASEVTIVWKDPEYDVLCKSRLDRIGELSGWPIILDVKTVSDRASLRNFQRSIANYGYAEQAAMYLSGLQALRPLDEEGMRKFLWLVCEVDPPYLVRLFEIEYAALEYGMEQYRKHLHEYVECSRSGNWPGYPEGVEIAGLPAWLQKAFDATL